MNNDYCVYMHTFPNGKRYIGQTKQKPEKRFGNGNNYKGCKYIYSAIQKYGWDNVKHEILVSGLSQKDADYYEKYYIALYKSNDRRYGYNLRTGGASGYQYTDDVKKLISEKQMGRKQSEQTRIKRSIALKNYYSTHEISEEMRNKLRRWNSGQFKQGVPHVCSAETREKISNALKGRKGIPLTDEQKQHLSRVFKERGATQQMMENIRPHQFKKGHAPSEKAMKTLQRKLSKKVIQCDLDGNALTVYPSIVAASKALGMSENAVGNAVRGYVNTAGGYIWRYADVN
ncbi:MAG: GIY-YIG nuclease family protein [Clostridiales bacterium]|nr:GIY-YIG nuclease family protein [Clostridiales bacterium]